MATNIPFPIRTKTSCLLKWNWSTIFLNTGEVSVCHRNKRIKIPKGFLIIPNTKAPIRSLPKKLLKSINAKEFLLKVTKESEPRNDKK